MTVELALQNERRRLSVSWPVGKTTIDQIAARDRTGRGILLRLVLPKNMTRIVQIESEGVVREGRVDIHYAVNDERRAFMAVEQTS